MTLQDMPFPGNGNGNCNGVGNPFDCETAAPIDEYSGYIMLAIIFLGCVFIMINSVYRLYKKKKKQTDWLEKYYEDEFDRRI